MRAKYIQHNTSILLTTVSTFLLLTLFLFMIDFVPETRVVADETEQVLNDLESTTTEQTVATVTVQPEDVEEVVEEVRSRVPVRIVVNDIEIDTTVTTPESSSIAVLDRALLHGAVHYPESALAGEEGNMLLFGHSSYLPVVQNQAFQAFNELGKLDPGSIVEVYSDTHRYDYRVEEVHLARAEETVISFEANTPQLTLATCNNFGAKQERWVATAILITSTPLTT